MRVQSEATSVSWIPSEAVTGLMTLGFATGVSHYDTPPPDELGDLLAMRDGDAFRFANRLSAWATFDGDRPTAYGRDGGLVMGSTTVRLGPVGATFAAVPMPDLAPEPEIGAGSVTYRQTCGGRTALPLPRRIARPPFVRLQAPLVWTTLALTLRADGSAEARLERASPFPRHWFYDAQGQLSAKAGLTDWEGWIGQASWASTPWGDQDSPVVVTAAESALERTLSTRIMRGGERPEIRRLAAGDVLTRQGVPGSDLYLLLDGVLAVDVDGERLTELGPGAVLGERALLEGGLRTSTLTAVTPVRVAVAHGSAIDRAALAELARGHRLEDRDQGPPA